MTSKHLYSVEFLHVYSDEQFNTEHTLGVQAAHDVLVTLPPEAISTTLLIDNYNPEQKEFNKEAFVSQATQHNLNIDHIAFEADLAHYLDDMLRLIDNNKFRTRYERYISSRKKIPCSFLTATWYLLRLGVLTPHNMNIVSHANKPFIPANTLINILPQRFQPTEDKAVSIIRHTRHHALADNIKNIYHASPITHHPSS